MIGGAISLATVHGAAVKGSLQLAAVPPAVALGHADGPLCQNRSMASDLDLGRLRELIDGVADTIAHSGTHRVLPDGFARVGLPDPAEDGTKTERTQRSVRLAAMLRGAERVRPYDGQVKRKAIIWSTADVRPALKVYFIGRLDPLTAP